MAGLDFSSLLTAGGTAAASAVSPWTLAAAAPAELFKLGKGIADRALAKKIDRSTQRPGFEIPAAAIEALGTQRNLAMGRAPGQTAAENLMLQSQAGNTNAILNSGGGSGERMAALLGQNQLANQSALQLGANQENWTASQNQNLISQLNRFEDWQQKKWMWDKQQPYEQAKAKAAELRGDANQNIYGALRGLGGQAAAVLTSGGGNSARGMEGGMKLKQLGDGSVMPSEETINSRMGGRTIEGGDPELTDAMSRIYGLKSPASGDATISDPDGLIQDPDGLINRTGSGSPSSVLGSPVAGYNFNAANRGTIPDPYNAYETGIQPTDNTQITPKGPSLQAMQMDRQLANERRAALGTGIRSAYPLFRGISQYLGGFR